MIRHIGGSINSRRWRATTAHLVLVLLRQTPSFFPRTHILGTAPPSRAAVIAPQPVPSRLTSPRRPCCYHQPRNCSGRTATPLATRLTAWPKELTCRTGSCMTSEETIGHIVPMCNTTTSNINAIAVSTRARSLQPGQSFRSRPRHTLFHCVPGRTPT